MYMVWMRFLLANRCVWRQNGERGQAVTGQIIIKCKIPFICLLQETVSIISLQHLGSIIGTIEGAFFCHSLGHLMDLKEKRAACSVDAFQWDRHN